MEEAPQNPETIAEYDGFGFVKGYVCSHCRSPVKLDHVDGIGTKWFKCSQCGQQSWKLKTEQRKSLENALAHLQEVKRPCTLEEVAGILDSTIKRDTSNKIITFLSMLLTYTEEDQFNVSFTAESSTGKSYIPLELVWYFPSEDVIEYSYVSPQAFYHEHGTLLPDPTDKREVEPEKRRKIKHIDLHRKILVFIDQPHDVLLQRLRPLLSHDRKTLVSKITDQRKTAGLVTKTVIIEGYPTVLFCTAKFSMEDQERTRLLLLSPDTTQSKIKDAILLRIEKESDRHAFKKLMDSDEKRTWLKDRVYEIATSNIRNVVIPEQLRSRIADQFFAKHTSLIPRHQRDIGRVLALIKACAMLNLWHRERVEDSIIVNEDDVTSGLKLYEQVSAANELGLPPEAFNVLEKLKPQIPESGVTRKEFQALYYQTFHKTIGKKRLDDLLNLLFSVGLLNEEPDPSDKRLKRLLLGAGVFIIAKDTTINTPQGMSNTVSLSDLVAVHWANELLAERECGVCGYKRVTSWQAETTKKASIPICDDCVRTFKTRREEAT